MNWEHADVVRVSGQSSSVVSQWLGKGSKPIHSITKVEAAVRLADASGFSAVWIASGKGPRRRPTYYALEVREPSAPWSDDALLERLGLLLAQVPKERRPAAADAMRGWVLDGGADHWREMFKAAVRPTDKPSPPQAKSPRLPSYDSDTPDASPQRGSYANVRG